VSQPCKLRDNVSSHIPISKLLLNLQEEGLVLVVLVIPKNTPNSHESGVMIPQTFQFQAVLGFQYQEILNLVLNYQKLDLLRLSACMSGPIGTTNKVTYSSSCKGEDVCIFRYI
jgi:hypothetical protein